MHNAATDKASSNCKLIPHRESPCATEAHPRPPAPRRCRTNGWPPEPSTIALRASVRRARRCEQASREHGSADNIAKPNAVSRLKGRRAMTYLKTQKSPQGILPCGPSRRMRRAGPARCRRPARIEKRPPRARRPALPQPRAAVLSAKAGLTAGFGMGPGDPRLCGRARGGRSPAASLWSLPGTPHRGDPGGRMAGTDEDHASRSVLQSRMRRARAISAARLSASPRLHLRPIDQVVYLGPYRRVDSSRRRLPA